MAPLISVVIPNLDGAEIIGDCLHAVLAQTLPPHEVIVADDGSRDGSADLVGRDFPEVRVVRRRFTGGFAAAASSGIEAAGGEWVALLNSDALPEPGWLEAAMRAADFPGRVGSIASKVMLAEPRGTIDSMGISVGKSGMARLRGHGERERPEAGGVSFEPVFGPAGSAAIYLRRALIEAGGFEESFESYYEDVDLAYRLRWRGWDCVLARDARVTHRHSYTMDRIKAPKRGLLQRNRLRTITRNWPAEWIIRHGVSLFAHDLGSVGLAAREGALYQAARARLEALQFLSADLDARRRILGGAVVSSELMGQWLSRG